MLNFLKNQWFILALILSVILGMIFPQAAVLNDGSRVTTVIVALVFLGMGFTLPSESLLIGLAKWKIHLFIQFFIFAFIPIFFIFTIPIFKSIISTEIYIGLLALAVLPTTISTCSVFTQISDGDVVLTLFNASFSNVIGVFVSPILLSLLLREVGRAMPMSVLIAIITGLALKMMLPLLIGQILRFVFLKTTAKLKKTIGVISNLLILTIVFFSLAESAATPMLWQNLRSMFIPVVYLTIVHLVLIGIATGCARVFKFTGPETISVMYAAPQKTLAMGIPLLSAYFADDPLVLGIAILPLLFYHPWELFISGVLKSLPIVEKWGKKAN
ncbi:MAG: bile acid:sodium symporter [Proteobacteria bacterium]|nr:bile acid:sodium symporter [Pseudomonadota bacterium]